MTGLLVGAVILLSIVLAFVLLMDLKDSIRWLKAERVYGLVQECVGEHAVHAYGTRRARRYYLYTIACTVDGRERVLAAALRRPGIGRGNLAEARYLVEDGDLVPIFPYAFHRLREFLIGGILGAAMAFAIIWYLL